MREGSQILSLRGVTLALHNILKFLFRYLGNVKVTPNIKKKVLKLGLEISAITYISGPNGVLRGKKKY